jgi:hypothetical protein
MSNKYYLFMTLLAGWGAAAETSSYVATVRDEAGHDLGLATRICTVSPGTRNNLHKLLERFGPPSPFIWLTNVHVRAGRPRLVVEGTTVRPLAEDPTRDFSLLGPLPDQKLPDGACLQIPLQSLALPFETFGALAYGASSFGGEELVADFGETASRLRSFAGFTLIHWNGVLGREGITSSYLAHVPGFPGISGGALRYATNGTGYLHGLFYAFDRATTLSVALPADLVTEGLAELVIHGAVDAQGVVTSPAWKPTRVWTPDGIRLGNSSFYILRHSLADTRIQESGTGRLGDGTALTPTAPAWESPLPEGAYVYDRATHTALLALQGEGEFWQEGEPLPPKLERRLTNGQWPTARLEARDGQLFVTASFRWDRLELYSLHSNSAARDWERRYEDPAEGHCHLFASRRLPVHALTDDLPYLPSRLCTQATKDGLRLSWKPVACGERAVGTAEPVTLRFRRSPGAKAGSRGEMLVEVTAGELRRASLLGFRSADRFLEFSSTMGVTDRLRTPDGAMLVAGPYPLSLVPRAGLDCLLREYPIHP